MVSGTARLSIICSMREQIGRYKLLDSIGRGRLGELFRARDTTYGRTVALRVVDKALAGSKPTRARLEADAQAAMAISHPCIAMIYEVGEDAGDLFVAMEYVPGDTLKRHTNERFLDPRETLAIGVAIADGLAELHAENVVHGQITASSIVVTPKEKAKLLDVGLTGWKTPAAKSPDPREDVRALAAVLAPVMEAGSQLPELAEVLQRAQNLKHEQTIDSAAALVAELMGLEAILHVRSGDKEL